MFILLLSFSLCLVLFWFLFLGPLFSVLSFILWNSLKRSQPEYAGIEMIRIPQVHCNISTTAKLGVINSQFYRFFRLCCCKKFFVFQMVCLIVFLKAKGYPFKVLLKRTRGLVLKEKFLFGISAFGIFRMILLQVM